jgi:hypothetical protein
MVKVIQPTTGAVFEDDIKIIDAELEAPLNIAMPPVFTRDEAQIFYRGHVFLLSPKVGDNHIKVYTETFGLEETDCPKMQEDAYFAGNKAAFDRLKQDFAERVLNGVSYLGGKFVSSGKISPLLGSELVKRIEATYSKLAKPAKQADAGKGLIAKLNDGSVFGSEMIGCERVLVMDKKIYDLLSLQEYIKIFESAIDSKYYKELNELAASATPEEIAKNITDHKDKIHRKVVPKVRNNIWHSNRSAKLFLDGAYWIPQFRASYADSVALYKSLLEKKLKIDAAKEIK